jgi:hypothetical protein
MGYGNGSQIGYQQEYPRYQQEYPRYQYYPSPLQMSSVQNVNPNPSPSPNNGMIWVQGIGGAKSFLLAPNSSVALWDSEDPVIYLKSTDANGMPTMKIIDYTIRDEQRNHNQAPLAQSNDGQFVTREDFDMLRAEMDRIRDQIDSLSNNKKEQRKDNNKNGQSFVSTNDGKRQ